MQVVSETNAPVATAFVSPSKFRLLSLDVLRGATIAAMMLVNNPGSWNAIYAPLEHAPWHGWTFTDLVFPFFLWIVGMAIPLSTARRLEQGQTRSELLRHAASRAALLFLLGLFLNFFSYLIDASLWREGFSAWCTHVALHLRIPGVLQRIGICYFCACAVFLFTGLRAQIAILLGLLSGYWLLMMLMPVPGYGAGILNKEGNFAGYIDNLVLNGKFIGIHVWQTARTWDPEGIVSTLPAIGTCLFGVLAGQLLRAYSSVETKTCWFFVTGSLLLFAGQLMSFWLPINKNLWTSSYAVFMAGMASICFAVLYWFIDVQGWQRWCKPFAIYGMNAITVFMLAGILGRVSLAIKIGGTGSEPAVSLKTWLFNHSFAFIPDAKIASLAWAIAYVLGLYLVAYLMYRRRWVVKL